MTSFQSNEMTSYCRTLGGRLNESLVFIVFLCFFSSYVGNGVFYLSTKYVLRLLFFPFLILNCTFLQNLDSLRLHKMCPSGWIQKWIRFTYNNFNSILPIITQVSLTVRYYQHWYITSKEPCCRSYTKTRCHCDHAEFLAFFLPDPGKFLLWASVWI